MEDPIKRPEKIKLAEINSYLTCYLCKGYLIDATTISECLHSFCRSCIIKFLQENSYCPICEVIINKAKPNLKLDKTLQDIVYKLVPELFLREMSRRKQYYQQYPQIAAKVSPEERGEDTERTIFNPQDCISLSLEYVSADSSPGAIKLLGSKNGSDKNDTLSPEDSQALMKRYLQCPGMCRVDVLKKFVRNKYNVDTTLFHIDILYKRVPLPDHYTLIDIAYIYSWKRNEPMKFFFRITDINKVSERFDYFDSRDPGELIVQFPLRNSRSNGTGAGKKREHALEKKKRKQESVGCLKKSAEVTDKLGKIIGDSSEGGDKQQKLASNKENVKTDEFSNDESPKRCVVKIKKDPEKNDCAKTEDNSSALKTSVTNAEEANRNAKNLVNPDDSGRLKTNGASQQSDVKNSVYTNITLNRTNNVEIITKIQKLSNKEGQPIGLNIIEQTYKANDTPKPQTQSQTKKSRPLLKYKPNNSKLVTKKHLINSNGKLNIPDIPMNPIVRKPTKPPVIPPIVENDEKLKFLQNLQLMSKEAVAKLEANKRKPTSPSKSGSPKKVKFDKKPVTRIILQSKPKPNEKLQTLIENCKIPSSLSITLKETSAENNKPSSVLPPVKNYIEILKLPDDTKDTTDSKETKFGLRMNDDSEQKVDEDLAEIAKSLTEKIPMSTTVSQIVGPKPEFTIPVKTNVPAKFNIQPSPVPELTSKLLNVPKENKLNPRSPQSFQKIFEESIKKPDQSSGETAGEVTSTSSNSSKRNIVEIASQLQMKAKPEQDKSPVESSTNKTTPKVAIPRLPHPKNLKTGFYEKPDAIKSHQTLTNLHSNALGLNYTVSVGPKANGVAHKADGEIKTTEVPVKSPLTVETKFPSPIKDLPKSSPKPNNLSRNISPNLNYNSPRNSPKHSPKSSPMIKHMYAPTPMEQLRINTFTPKTNSLSKTSPSLSKGSPSPTSSLSPKPSHSGSPVPAPPLNPNQILERFNIQNLAQLAKNLNFHAAANFGANATNQLSTLQHAMLLKHFEMQNRQNWLNMNQTPQYEKYLQNLQNLKTGQN